MKINQLIYYSKEELFKRLRKVNIYRKVKQFPYLNANFEIIRLPIRNIQTTQLYVLRNNLNKIATTWRQLNSMHINPCNLEGFLRLFLSDTDDDCFDVLPIVTEASPTDTDRVLLCDGMHRLFLSHQMGYTSINAIYITNVDPKFPYYALPSKLSIEDVPICDEPPKIRKKYRIRNYKSLFRDFNSQFINVTKVRKRRIE